MRYMSALAITALTLVSAVAAAQTTQPPFVAVQRDMLAVAGSLSNAWADYDKDGDLDYAVSLKSGEIRLYRNDGGTLTSVGGAMGLPTKGGEFRALSWGDYDGDGWLDLLAGATLPANMTAIFHNLAGKGFRDVAAEIGLTVPGRSSRQNNWVDYDNDGDVDLFATDRAGVNKLFRNDAGRFVPVFTDGPINVARSTVGACWFDYDRDGDLDLFLANQSGKPDALLRNDRDRFTDVAPALGMDRPGRPVEEGGVGCAIGDYDRDGHLDLFVPSYGVNVLWRNRGDGTFQETGKATGVGIENHAVGAAFGDWDNDGYPDLAVMSYEGKAGEQVPHDSLFHNRGGTSFVNVIERGGALDAGDHGVTFADYDADGAIDLSVTDGYSATGGHFVFRNTLASAAAGRSLSVIVLDGKGRHTQAGAEVRLFDRAGALLGTGQVSTGGGYGAQGVTPVHFGVPKARSVTVEVTFMSPAGRVSQRVRNVDLAKYRGRSLVVRRVR